MQISTKLSGAGKTPSLQFLQSVPEEEIWLAGQLSDHTRRAYKRDVMHFVATMRIQSADELRNVNRAAVVAGHGLDFEGPLFRPVRGNQVRREEWRPLNPGDRPRDSQIFSKGGELPICILYRIDTLAQARAVTSSIRDGVLIGKTTKSMRLI